MNGKAARGGGIKRMASPRHAAFDIDVSQVGPPAGLPAAEPLTARRRTKLLDPEKSRARCGCASSGPFRGTPASGSPAGTLDQASCRRPCRTADRDKAGRPRAHDPLRQPRPRSPRDCAENREPTTRALTPGPCTDKEGGIAPTDGCPPKFRFVAHDNGLTRQVDALEQRRRVGG